MATKVNIIKRKFNMGCKKLHLYDTPYGYMWSDKVTSEITLEHEPEKTDYIIKHLKKGQVFVDVGAKYGYFSIIASALGATVYAFEPNPISYRRLILNSLVNDFIIHESGCGERNCIMPFVLNDGKSKIDIDGCININVNRLDECIDKCDMVKIDTEGYEMKVLEGMKHLVKACKPIILIDEHPPLTTFKMFQDWANKNRYNIKRLGKVKPDYVMDPK